MPSGKRRDRGSGSIYFDPTRDLWVGVASLGRKPDGSRWRETVYRKSQPEVRDALRKLYAETKDRSSRGSPRTLGAFLPEWVEHCRTTLKATSTFFYEDKVDRFLLPHLATVPLCEVTAFTAHKLFAALAELKVPVPSQRAAFVTFRAAMSYAVDPLKLIPMNPLRGVKAPRSTKAPLATWTAGEVVQFLESSTAAGDWMEAYYVLSVLQGGREGEWLGLPWSCVDLQARTLRIAWTLPEVDGEILPLTEPKSEASRRVLTLGDAEVDALKRQQARLFGAGLRACPMVFPNMSGGYWYKSNLRRHFLKAIAAAGIKRIRPHDMRHTCATLLMKAGVSPEVVRQRLGHSKIATTLGTYTHADADSQRAASGALASLLKQG